MVRQPPRRRPRHYADWPMLGNGTGNGNGDNVPLWLKALRAVAYLGAPTVISLYYVWYTTTKIDRDLQGMASEHQQLSSMLNDHQGLEEQAIQIIANRLRVICLNSATTTAALDACQEGVDSREYWQRLRREKTGKPDK